MKNAFQQSAEESVEKRERKREAQPGDVILFANAIIAYCHIVDTRCGVDMAQGSRDDTNILQPDC